MMLLPSAEESLPWLLLELKAYVAKYGNATTAFSSTWDGKRIQVTFCPRRPLRVSYMCVHSPDAAEIHVEPTILAMEDDLTLLGITVGPRDDVNDNIDYYVYATRKCAIRIGGPKNPNTPCDSKSVSLSKQQRQRHDGKHFYHRNCKVMAIRGDAGTMAFVDLWWGIIFCDVLTVEREAVRRVLGKPMALLRYVTPMQNNKTLKGDVRLYRDIAVVGDRLKYDTKIMDSTDVKVHNKLCPKAWRDEGMALSPFRELDACQPVLGLQEDADVVYFTTKIDRGDADARVVSVDMRKKELLGVAAFAAQRYDARISEHLMKS
ncbi:hypothetical protein SETIT_2G300400v2 [Setaria italica]|uniref:DUF1618 domain-containing protein n=2 Tax=Setaria italica TaxID=4555 RepID=A0A368Q4B5_SETIT|nr:hypothetical protein SETIT_2G300400v2 [Setaria italica]